MKGAVVLSFDDWHLAEWVKFLPELQRQSARATFYVCLRRGGDTGPAFKPAALTATFWKRVAQLQDAGHTIGFHTVNHAVMDFPRIGLENPIIDREIDDGLAMFRAHGIPVRHFAYPGGRRQVWIDEALRRRFVSLRGVAAGAHVAYGAWVMRGGGLFFASDIDEPIDDKSLRESLERGFRVLIFGHNPATSRGAIERLFRVVREAGAEFLNMEEATS